MYNCQGMIVCEQSHGLYTFDFLLDVLSHNSQVEQKL